MRLTLGDLARRLDVRLTGDPECEIRRIRPLDRAGNGDLSYLYDRKYRKFLKITGASAVILHSRDLPDCPIPALVARDPYLAYAKAVACFHAPFKMPAGVHESASIDPRARIDPSAWIGPCCVIGSGAEIGEQVRLGPGCCVGRGVRIGGFSELQAHVILCEGTMVGRRCVIQPGVVLGADGFSMVKDGERWLKIHSLGGLYVGDDVEIGANSTIDRGGSGDTYIGDRVKIDNQVHVAHGVQIGQDTAIAGCAAIAGGARIGRRCTIGGGAAITGHISIADDVVIMGRSQVSKSISKAGTYSSALTAKENRQWLRQLAVLSRLAKTIGGGLSVAPKRLLKDTSINK